MKIAYAFRRSACYPFEAGVAWSHSYVSGNVNINRG